MAVGIRTTQTNTNNGGSPTTSVTTDASPQVGDVAIAIHANDYYPATNMPAPTGGPGGWAEVVAARADAGDTGAHIKIWWAVVASAGAMTVSVTETGDANEEKCLAVWVLSGVDTTTPVDAAASGTGTGTANVAPSCSPTGTDSFLICAIESGGGASTASFTTPGTMTERYELHVGGLSHVAASQQLSGSGATGTRTFTAASSIPYAASSLAVKAAAGGVSRDMAGQTTAAASLTGAAAMARPLAAAVAAAAGVLAAVAMARALVGSADAAAELAGALGTARPVAGAAASAAELAGSLTTDRPLSAVAAAAATVDGSLVAARAVSAVCAGATSATGELTVSALVALAGDVSASSSLVGRYDAGRSLVAMAAAATGAEALTIMARGLVGASPAAGSAAGLLTLTVTVAGGAWSASWAGAALSVTGTEHNIDLIATLAPRRWAATLEERP
ncbi:MAG TPA: hypothetical protein VFX53_17035 [Pedococcus sp.]|nr:hypothetical protein [Pedococcus sp.]